MATFDSRGSVNSGRLGGAIGVDHRGTAGQPPPEPTPDTTPPVVTLVSPTDGEVSADTPVVFDVTEEGVEGFCELFVWVVFASDGSSEVIHDGDSFATRYVGLSARSTVTGGFRYTVRRSEGWPSSPRVRVKVIDTAGNVSS